MKILACGPQGRYHNNLPDFVGTLPVELVFSPRDATPQQRQYVCPDAEILFVDAITPVTAQLMDLLPKLRLIHSEGVGYNAIDVDAARERGIFVCNNKGCNSSAVAEQTILLMLMLTRLGVPGHNSVREGRQIQYKEQVMLSSIPELGDHSVGFVGFGDTVQATARRLLPFGCPLYYYAPHRRPAQVEQAFQATYLPLDELAATCDIVVLLCAVNDQTRGMVDDAFLRQMKPTAYLINTGRGDLVCNDALRAALEEGRLAGAGLDVIDPEPTPADHILVDLPPAIRDRVVYSPHLGGITGTAFRRAHLSMWQSVQQLLAGGRPRNIVNGL